MSNRLSLDLPPIPPGDDDFPRLMMITLGDIIVALEKSTSRFAKKNLSKETAPGAVFKNGIKLNAAVAEFALTCRRPRLSDDITTELFQVVGSPSELIQFKYALFDEGSGREFQSEPILNIAGLGSAER